MSESEKQTELVPTQSIALTKPGAKSLIARGHVDLRNNGEAEAWLKKGLDFYNKHQYEKAFARFERGIRLDPNHPELQYWIGDLLFYGLGVDQDFLQATTWFRKACEQGHSKAQNSLGLLVYSGGEGVPHDYKLPWGLFDRTDYTQAVSWFRKSAEQGWADGQFNLGVMYHRGEGVPQDDTQAVFWYRKAAEQGDSSLDLGIRFEIRGRLGGCVASAQYNLGVMYHRGEGVPQDYTQAAFWFRKAAEQGHSVAETHLALMYEVGQGVPQDYTQAVFWYRKSAQNRPLYSKRPDFWYHISAEDRNCSLSPYCLGVLFAGVLDVSEHDTMGPFEFSKGPEHEFSEARYNLGLTRYTPGLAYHRRMGERIEDDEQASFWFRKATEEAEPHFLTQV